MKKIVSTLLIIFMLTIISTSGIAQASSITISKTKATMEVDSTLKLKITGTDKKITWSSNKKSVATVSNEGVITAKAEGTAIITATVSSKKYNCKVTVVDNNKVTPTPSPTPSPPTVSPTPVPEPEKQSDKDYLNEQEVSDLTLNSSKYLGKYAEVNVLIATDPETDGNQNTCLAYQDLKNKTKIIYLRYFDRPEFKKGDKVYIFGYIETIYSGPGVDSNNIEAPVIVVKEISLLEE